MAQGEETNVSRLVVVFLRFYSDMTQAELGKAARVDQSDISKYELGKLVPPEPNLRRMAEAAGVEWAVITQLRRFYAAILPAAARRGPMPSAELLTPSLLEPVLAAVAPYLIDEVLTEPDPRQREEDRREAAAAWTALARFPIPVRRRWIELSLRASRSLALAEKILQESERVADEHAEEAGELAELARRIAERVPLSPGEG